MNQTRIAQRQLLVMLPVQLLFEYAVCYAIAAFFPASTPTDTVIAAFYLFLALWAARTAIAILNLAHQVFFFFFTKRRTVANVVGLMHKHKMPVVDEYQWADVSEVFALTAYRADSEKDLCAFLFTSLGELQGMRMTNWVAGAIWYAILDAAWNEYRNQIYARSNT